MRFNNWKIGLRLSCLAGILILFLLVIAFLGLFSLKQVNRSLETVYNDRVVPLEQLKAVSDMYAVNIVDLSHKIRLGQLSWEEALRSLRNARETIDRAWTAYRETYIVGEERSLLEQALPLMQEANNAIDQLESVIADRQQAALDAFIETELYQRIDPITNQIDKLASIQLDIAATEYEESLTTYRKIRTVTVSAIVLALLIAGALSFLIIRGITIPLAKTVEMIEALAQGNLDLRLSLNRKDEIGRLALAMDAFANNLRDEVLGAFQSLAAGDFSFKAEGLIRDPLKKANTALCDLVRQIQMASEQIASGSSQIADAAQSLSQGATESAASLEQISASMTEMASQTRQNAENATQANQLSLQAKNAAEEGNQKMQNMVLAMNDINEAGHNISKIIKVIDEIAFQTNLLALNAAVEAARAGQHGKGFAVVAEEVRNLAARSAQAAKETAELIEGSVQKTQNGSQIATETEESLKEIVNTVIKTADIVGEIAAASNEQAEGIGQVNTGLGQIDQVTQANTANAEESAAAAEELAGHADQLRKMLNRFNLGQQTGTTISNVTYSKREALPDPTANEENHIKNDCGPKAICLDDSEFGKY